MQIFHDAIEALGVSYRRMNPFCIPFVTTNMGSAMLAMDLVRHTPAPPVDPTACVFNTLLLLSGMSHTTAVVLPLLWYVPPWCAPGGPLAVSRLMPYGHWWSPFSSVLGGVQGWMGPNYSISTACATSNHCILSAAQHIQRGDAVRRKSHETVTVYCDCML